MPVAVAFSKSSTIPPGTAAWRVNLQTMLYYTVFLTYHQISKVDKRNDGKFALRLMASGLTQGASFFSVKFFDSKTTGHGWECQLELYFSDKKKNSSLSSLDIIDLSYEWKQKASRNELSAWLSDVTVSPHQDEYIHIVNSRANNPVTKQQ